MISTGGKIRKTYAELFNVVQGLVGLYRNADSYKLSFEAIDRVEEAARQQYKVGYGFTEASNAAWAELWAPSGPEVPLKAGSPLEDGSRPNPTRWAKGMKEVKAQIKEDFDGLISQIPDPLPQGYPLDETIAYLNNLTQQIKASWKIGGGAYQPVKFKDIEAGTVKDRSVVLGEVSDGRAVTDDLYDAWMKKLDVQYTSTLFKTGETILHVTTYAIPASGISKKVSKGLSDLYEVTDLIEGCA